MHILLIIALFMVIGLYEFVGFEGLAFLFFSVPFTALFFWRWYVSLKKIWPPDRNALAKKVFGVLPLAAAPIMFFTLNDMASFDVVSSFTFNVYYMLMGYAVIYVGLMFMRKNLDLSWAHDGIDNDNKAAVPAIAGGYIALATIYSGANVGDGPGWWCVIFACALGYFAWFLLWTIFHLFTNIFERVTVERDVCCGIRLGCYFIATGIILARASAGDWTSFEMTVIEFADGWSVLIFMAVMLALELTVYRNKFADERKHLFLSITFGILSIVLAAVTVIFLIRPLPENTMYDMRAQETEQPYLTDVTLCFEHGSSMRNICMEKKIIIETKLLDSIAALPRDIKNDAIRNYLNERGLISENTHVYFPEEKQ